MLKQGAQWNDQKKKIVVPAIKADSYDRYDVYEEDTYVKNHSTGHIVNYKKVVATFKEDMDMQWFPFDI